MSLDSGFHRLGGGETADMAKSPVCENPSQNQEVFQPEDQVSTLRPEPKVS